ncbi:MAG TPA: DUF4450 domain-containing protein [Phycisphaerae bacterium]|nr:DUF4450 domain-containing protein [Phycisphaerae bacterium]
MKRAMRCAVVAGAVMGAGFFQGARAWGQTATGKTRGVIAGETARPLRYRAMNGDFVIDDGAEFFNRPLYADNAAFRADGGDKPEFSFYSSGHAGNLRFAMIAPGGAKWFSDAAHITATYHPGEMIYDLHDPLLGDGVLHLRAVSLDGIEGHAFQVSGEKLPDKLQIFFALGGADGKKGSRNGDIGAESQPVMEFFQVTPQACGGNTVSAGGTSATLQGRGIALTAYFPAAARAIPAAAWSDPGKAAGDSSAPQTNVFAGSLAALSPQKPLYALITKAPLDTTRPFDPAALFAAGEKHRDAVADRVTVDTPDAFINSAMAALNVAGDAVWDGGSHTVMHGAVAWRSKLLGWRGPYILDELGYHDRMTQQINYWAAQQIVGGEIPKEAHADPKKNLAADDWKMLHTDGDLSKSHYDMNLAYFDYYLRHALWTGDVELLKQTWPVLVRHLAWEQRCFRRPFGGQDGSPVVPLYEAYACIWASDNLQYNGGGATHATALNYFDNMMAARIAKIIGEDGTPYEKEAGLILQGMHKELWLPERGIYAESRDILGSKAANPSPGLWTFYHTVDSQAADGFEAYQMGRYVDTEIGHIPIHGPGVPEGDFYLLPETNWSPYMWSINNVVLAEDAATALADYQSGPGRAKQGFAVLKGSILDSMFMGLCPGNTHMSSQFDDNRGESQRDFADPTAMMTRAIVEGLFGVRPDLLAGEVTVAPAFPAGWDHAAMKHPDFSLSFVRKGDVDSYEMAPHFAKSVGLRFVLPAKSDHVAAVTVNGQAAPWKAVADAVGSPEIEVDVPAAAGADAKAAVSVTWGGNSLSVPTYNTVDDPGNLLVVDTGTARYTGMRDPQTAVTGTSGSGNGFVTSATNELGWHTIFVHLRQGDFAWWSPVDFETRPAMEIVSVEPQEKDSLKFEIRNNSGQALDERVTVRAGGHEEQVHAAAAKRGGLSEVLTIPAEGLLPGANRVAVALQDGRRIEGTAVNWQLQAPTDGKMEAVDLSRLLNANVADIFRTDYLEPRSPYVSLAIPKQGIGGWAMNTFDPRIDDSGVRAHPEVNVDGVVFKTAATGDNIAFTSEWKNHPDHLTIPLNGKATHVYLLMAGSTSPMRSHMENGELVVAYQAGASDRVALVNPTNWWPIEQDYFIDDYQFDIPGPLPPRVDLQTGRVRIRTRAEALGKRGLIPGGSATVLDVPVDPERGLKSLTVRATAYEPIIGVMAVTVAR